METCIDQRGMQTVRLTTMTENTSSPDKTGTHDAKKSFSTEERRFRYDDRRYIDRGQLWTLQISTAILTQGVEKLNCGKVGRPFVFSNACFAAAFLFRNATNIRYRQLQGVAEAMVGRENAPTYSAFQKRMTKLGCTFDEEGSGNTTSAWFSDGNARTEISLYSVSDSLFEVPQASAPVRAQPPRPKARTVSN